MTNAMLISPPRFPDGPVDGRELNRVWAIFYRDLLARMDIRYGSNDMAAGIVAGPDRGVVLGTRALPAGRIVGVPSLVSKIGDNGRAADQRFLPQVSAGNVLSVQSTLPLLSQANASTASVRINPHTLQYGYGAVSYNAGSIVGLEPNKTYYIYSQDPDYEGGAVSYYASENPQAIVADNGRYFVGTVETIIASNSQGVNAASTADPILITTASDHAWGDGDQVTFSSMSGGFNVLDGTTQEITITADNQFTIPVSGVGFVAYTGGGTVTRTGQASQGTSGGGAGGRIP